jgi:hypothetical protein
VIERTSYNARTTSKPRRQCRSQKGTTLVSLPTRKRCSSRRRIYNNLYHQLDDLKTRTIHLRFHNVHEGGVNGHVIRHHFIVQGHGLNCGQKQSAEELVVPNVHPVHKPTQRRKNSRVNTVVTLESDPEFIGDVLFGVISGNVMNLIERISNDGILREYTTSVTSLLKSNPMTLPSVKFVVTLGNGHIVFTCTPPTNVRKGTYSVDKTRNEPHDFCPCQ